MKRDVVPAVSFFLSNFSTQRSLLLSCSPRSLKQIYRSYQQMLELSLKENMPL